MQQPVASFVITTWFTSCASLRYFIFRFQTGGDLIDKLKAPVSAYQAWIDGKYRYRTSDAGREYINHDDSLFVYLGSVSDINDEYYQNYRNRWDFHVDLRNITHDTVYLGETTFEGYDCFPVQERGSNCFNKPQNVYSYTNDTNLLLVSSGNDAAVYVKLQGSDSKETGMYR
jgi:hypothetical protein